MHLPLPSWSRDRRLFILVAAIHVYLGGGHVFGIVGPHATGMDLWTDIWKGFGAWLGAYYFLALSLPRPATK